MYDFGALVSVGCTIVVSAVAIGRTIMARGAADERQRNTEIRVEALEKKTGVDRAEIIQLIDASNRARVEQIDRLENKLEKFSSELDGKFERSRNESSQHHAMMQSEIKALSQAIRDLELSSARSSVLDQRTDPSWPGLKR